MSHRAAISACMLAAWCCAAVGQTRDIAADVYLDKLRGMWMGEILGNYAGRPMEGRIATGGLDYTVPWASLVQTPAWEGDDDTALEYMYMNVLVGNANPSAADARQTWLDHVPSGAYYIANKQARWLMNYGYTPPATGSIANNIHWYAIDSQIATEAVGSACPGLRQTAADLTNRFATVTNDGLAVHAAQFYAAMYASAAFESDVPTIITKGLEVVPTTSRTHQVIDDVIAWHAADPGNWRATQTKIYQKYFLGDQGRYMGWVESTVNVGLTTLSLLYGEGDFKKTVEIGVQAGFDCDCNPATAAGLLGMIQGYSHLPGDLTSAISNAYHVSTLVNIPTDTTVSAVAAGWQSAAEAQILAAGGSISGSGTARTYHLPAADVVTAPAELPDPTGPRGLVKQVRDAGGSVGVSASVVQTYANTDRTNLAAIIDGIYDVRYNGHRPYNTDDGANAQPAGGDWYALTFDRQVTFASVIYHEGDIVYRSAGGTNADPRVLEPRGGWFDSLSVEVQRDGVWQEVSNLRLSEVLDPYAYYQHVEMCFDPIVGDAVRIRGLAGGTDQFTSIVELEAFDLGLLGDADHNGLVDQRDYAAWFNGNGVARTCGGGDFDNNGMVDQRDYALWFAHNGLAAGDDPASGSVPEPTSACLLMIAGGALIGRRR